MSSSVPKLISLRVNFGAPISRVRIYIILVRRSLMVKMANCDFDAFAAGIVKDLGMKTDLDWNFGLHYETH